MNVLLSTVNLRLVPAQAPCLQRVRSPKVWFGELIARAPLPAVQHASILAPITTCYVVSSRLPRTGRPLRQEGAQKNEDGPEICAGAQIV